MQQYIQRSLAVLAAAITLSATPSLAQSPEQSPARQQAVQAARYGTALGLPRDGGKLYLPDEAYPRFPLPPGNAAYAHIDGLKMKEVVEQIAAISRKSRDDGNQYWGRIPGTPYDRMMQDWAMSRFKALGMQDVQRQAIAMKPLWFPTSWAAEFTAAGKTVALKSAFPITESPATKGRVSAPVWRRSRRNLLARIRRNWFASIARWTQPSKVIPT